MSQCIETICKKTVIEAYIWFKVTSTKQYCFYYYASAQHTNHKNIGKQNWIRTEE